MELPYKLHLGAGCISRPDFLRHLARAREHTPACSPETARVWPTHGSILIAVTLQPQSLRSRPIDDAVMPFPRPLITPPVTTT